MTAWSNDFGLNWYFDSSNNSINFIDLTAEEIKVDKSQISSYVGKSLISYEEYSDSSITFDSKVISWYQSPGEVKDFECSKMQ